MCKLFHIGSDLLISKRWHSNPLSSVLLWQNDYFFIISLIFHHYCTSTSFLPNYHCQLPFWEAIMRLTSIIFHLWSGPRARAPLEDLDVIFVLCESSFRLWLFPAPLSCCCCYAILLSLATQWHLAYLCRTSEHRTCFSCHVHLQHTMICLSDLYAINMPLFKCSG